MTVLGVTLDRHDLAVIVAVVLVLAVLVRVFTYREP